MQIIETLNYEEKQVIAYGLIFIWTVLVMVWLTKREMNWYKKN